MILYSKLDIVKVINNFSCNTKESDWPELCVSWAQSLDGKIGRRGRRVIISGEESTELCHSIRGMSNAILVGESTLIADNPKLTVRHRTQSNNQAENPIPIILGNSLEWITDSIVQAIIANDPRQIPVQVIKQAVEKSSPAPWFICTKQVSTSVHQALLILGSKILYINTPTTDSPYWSTLFTFLKSNGLDRVMIEGGSCVISRLISALIELNRDALLCVTIGPLFLGDQDAVNLSLKSELNFDGAHLAKQGNDLVFISTLKVSQR